MLCQRFSSSASHAHLGEGWRAAHRESRWLGKTTRWPSTLSSDCATQ